MQMRQRNASPARAPATAAPPLPLRLGVVVADAVHMIRAGLRLLIESQPDMEVLAEAASGDEGIQLVRRLRRRTRVVALIGLGLSGEHDAFWLLRAIRERCPSWSILACGVNVDRLAISRALFVGADGFVDQSALPPQFFDAIRGVASGELVLAGVPPDWLGPIVEGIDRHRDGDATLTVRERQVLSVAAEGLTAREIGRRLGMSERTVTTHLCNIYDKLGVSGRVEALTAAARSGLVSIGWFE